MARILFLVPPSKQGYIRDTYYGCWHRRKFVNYYWPPHHLYLLHAMIPDSAVIDAGLQQDYRVVIEKISRIQPEYVVSSTGTFTFDEDSVFFRELKSSVDCRTVLFGELPTLNPKIVLDAGADFAIRGEPEAVLPHIIKFGRRCKAKGACFNGHFSNEKAVIEVLDRLPFPKRDISAAQDYQNPFALRKPFTAVLATRGCPHECIFCTSPILYGKRFRKRSVRNVVSELGMLQALGFKEFFFRDENITLERGYIHNLCRGIMNAGISMGWMANSRVDTVDEETIGMMRTAGCHLLKFGVESSSEETLKRIRKGASKSQIINAFRLCRAAGIETVAHFIIGNPGESPEDVNKNIDFAMELEPDYASFDVLLRYPGTKVFSEASSFDEKTLERLHDYAFRKFYLRPRLIFRHLSSVKSLGQCMEKTRCTLQLWKQLIKK